MRRDHHELLAGASVPEPRQHPFFYDHMAAIDQQDVQCEKPYADGPGIPLSAFCKKQHRKRDRGKNQVYLYNLLQLPVIASLIDPLVNVPRIAYGDIDCDLNDQQYKMDLRRPEYTAKADVKRNRIRYKNTNQINNQQHDI